MNSNLKYLLGYELGWSLDQILNFLTSLFITYIYVYVRERKNLSQKMLSLLFKDFFLIFAQIIL